MLYYLGVLFIVLFNIAVLYDLTQHNEELYRSNFSLFLYVIVFFCLIELLLFTLVYIFVINSIGLLT